MTAGLINSGIDSISLSDEVLPGFRLIERLGRGGFAEVWEAESPGGFRVALKLVRLSSKTRPRELRAIENIRDIRHPNLLTTFGAWQREDLLIIGMELAERSLWDRFIEVRSQGLRGIPRRELLGYLSVTAEAIDYLNRAQHAVGGRSKVGIQHRDLKPQNILLFGSSAKVADFGVSRIMEEGVVSHTGTWTLAYAAPEFFHGLTSHHSDQYSLAISYCQLRGGRLPFRGATAEIAAGHMLFPPDLEALPLPERPIVARALSKQPDERWPDCRSFSNALQSLASDDPDAIPEQLVGRDDEELALERPVDSAGLDLETPLRLHSNSLTTESPSPPFPPPDSQDELASFHVLDRLNPPALATSGSSRQRSGHLVATVILACGLALSIAFVRLPEDRTLLHFSPVNMAGPAADSSPTGENRHRGSKDKISSTATVEDLSGQRWSPSRREPSGGRPFVPAPTSVGLKSALLKPSVPWQPGVLPLAPPAPDVLPTTVERTQQTPPLAAPERMPVGGKLEVPSAAEEVPEEFDEYADSQAVATSSPSDHRTSLALPDRLSLHQGEQVRLPVRIEGSKLHGPLTLRFAGLPAGVTLRCPTFAGGDGIAEAVVSASSDAPTSEAEVEVSVATQPTQTLAQLKISILPDPSRVATERGRAHLLQGSYPEAITAFSEAVQLDPQRAEAYIGRGQAHQLMRRYPDALADYTEALRSRSTDAYLYMIRARVRQETGSLVGALDDYSEAIRLQPKDANLYLSRGRILHDLGQYDRAQADFTEVIRLRPDDLAAHYRRGLVRYHSGDNAGAIDDFSLVIRVNPRHANAYHFRSEAYARSGNGARAIADHDDFDRLTFGRDQVDRDQHGPIQVVPPPEKSQEGRLPLKARTRSNTPTRSY